MLEKLLKRIGYIKYEKAKNATELLHVKYVKDIVKYVEDDFHVPPADNYIQDAQNWVRESFDTAVKIISEKK